MKPSKGILKTSSTRSVTCDSGKLVELSSGPVRRDLLPNTPYKSQKLVLAIEEHRTASRKIGVRRYRYPFNAHNCGPSLKLWRHDGQNVVLVVWALQEGLDDKVEASQTSINIQEDEGNNIVKEGTVPVGSARSFGCDQFAGPQGTERDHVSNVGIYTVVRCRSAFTRYEGSDLEAVNVLIE